ncbi:hypothetical protein FNF27_01112 [Cafeteria roenbergensis]|uniref:Uncharacterized protein n=1 Tax=Cafeteria roenbergensis TaxID=33653 RepID=A0A5A8CMU0_CAFRO|nr:hypothetical protein FNF31_06388 [Cafeteria roenbergensis]KAA0156747.1 hypothetical protein FNF29_00858 [Cafeteria roenbergensis]KAA0177334.1 hypothetical protein FNF27_01112 [Cafeteria roenbergensis]|eukprot:KAA0156747.1 hypothetical protein FNF29_00858 [Cafeteria roenbergensis]
MLGDTKPGGTPTTASVSDTTRTATLAWRAGDVDAPSGTTTKRAFGANQSEKPNPTILLRACPDAGRRGGTMPYTLESATYVKTTELGT